jgi:hypothetical protein
LKGNPAKRSRPPQKSFLGNPNFDIEWEFADSIEVKPDNKEWGKLLPKSAFEVGK